MTREELARSVLEMFKLQRAYFHPATRGPATLEASRAAEKELRHECERILEPPGLFGGEDDDGE